MNTPTPMPGTALPWRYIAGEVQAFTDGKPGIVVRRKNATVSIAYMGSEERDANAAYIVWACNNAPALLSALEKNLGTLLEQAARCERWGKSHAELDCAIDETRTALSTAGGRNG